MNQKHLMLLLLTHRPPQAAVSSARIRFLQGNLGLEEISTEEVETVPKFIKRILKTGGYCVIFISLSMFQEWYNAFDKCGFSVMLSVYLIIYDEVTPPKRTVTEFPQIMNEFALIATAPGEHPAGFRPDFNAEFQLLNCRSSRRKSSVERVPFGKHKLTRPNSKIPYRMSEKPIGLLSELVDLFTPVRGNILDMYAGTFTTCIACIRMSRRCFLTCNVGVVVLWRRMTRMVG